MGRYDHIDPMDLDPDTGRPYSNYSSPALDTSFHDAEMACSELADLEQAQRELNEMISDIRENGNWLEHRARFNRLSRSLAELGGEA